MRGVVVEVSATRFGIPFECPCCGATPPASELPITARQTGQTLLFPYCNRCVKHVRAFETSGVISAGVMVIGIAAAMTAAIIAGWLAAVGTFVVFALIAWTIRNARRKAAASGRVESCASTGIAVEYRGWSGATSAFTFESPTFAARFAEQNSSLLENVSPELRKLVDRYHKARLAVPTPAVAAGVAPPPMNARDWIARIESTEGTVARRVQLQRALDMIEEPPSRRELIQTVVRIELAPLVAKLNRLTSPATKKSLLQSSVSQLQADNVFDELQAAELEALNARLAELG
jgi:hypothetical protein